MNINRKSSRASLIFAAIALLICLTTARAQSNAPAAEQKSNKSGSEGEQKPPDEIEQLKTKVGQLESLIEQQQRALAEMQKRVDEIEGKTKARPAQAASQPGDATPEVKTAALELGQAQKNESSSAAGNQRENDKSDAAAGWDKNHAFIRSADGSFETQIAGYAQLDFRGYQSGTHPPNTFLVRRVRLALEGKLHRYFEYKVEGDFADTSSTLLRDFYLNIHRIDELQFRFGQFRVPISQEEIRSDNTQDFVERSLVNNLVPSRSPGMMISGVFNKRGIEYQIGAFNGKGLLEANDNGTPETALRLRFAPWKNGNQFWLKGLIFGGAYTQGRSFGGASVRGQTESRSATFFSPDTINGRYIRANGEMTWLLGPAAFRAEYDQTNQSRNNLGPLGTNLPGVVGKGYMAQFTYLLTGETKPEAGVVDPKGSLFGDERGKAGLGAWELKFRYANLQIANGTAKSNRAETFYFGPNWYLNRFVRYMLDFGIERFKDPLRSPNPRDRNFFVVLSRIQVAF